MSGLNYWWKKYQLLKNIKSEYEKRLKDFIKTGEGKSVTELRNEFFDKLIRSI